jgi:predicted outer membrane repeat protein
MAFFSWLRNSGSTSTRLSTRRLQSSGRRPPSSYRPRCEMLEARNLLAAVMVTEVTDDRDGDTSSIAALISRPGGDGISLREAILASNNTTGTNSISFDRGTSGAPILLSHGPLEITNGVVITGLGAANTTVSGESLSRIFVIQTTFADPRSVTLDGLTLTAAKSTGTGGAIRSQFALLTVSNSTISNNIAGNGGGIYSFNPVTVINSTISDNTAIDGGGGISAQDLVTVIGSTIANNSAGRSGGGISSSRVNVSNSTISGNHAVNRYGGGIDVSSKLSVINSTISGNVASADGGGGGVYGWHGANVTISSSTISNNFAGYGGGMFAEGPVTISNSIVAGNSDLSEAADLALYDSFPAISNSLIGQSGDTILSASPVGAADSDGNFIGTATAPIIPMLGPLADNGGRTQTMALTTGSRAVNAGNNRLAVAVDGTPLRFDQRGSGFARIRGGRVDMGAYEFQANQAPTITVPAAQTAYEDVDSPIGGLSVGDPDGDNLIITLRVGHGSLNLGSAAGLSVAGDGSGNVILVGSVIDLNAALAGVSYRGGLNYSGGDTLVITASDGSLLSNNSVAITVQSARLQALDLQSHLNALRDAGVLNRGQSNSLYVKLNLNDNNGDVGKVTSLLNEINAQIMSGILTQDQADALSIAAKILRLSLTRR